MNTDKMTADYADQSKASLVDAVDRQPALKDRRKKKSRVRKDRRQNSKMAVGLEISPSGISIAFIRSAPNQGRELQTDFVPFPSDVGPAVGDWGDGTIRKAMQELVERYRLNGQAVSVGLGGAPCVTRGWFGENADVDLNIAENRERTHRYLSLGRGDKVAAYFESSVDAKRKRAWLTVARREVVEAIAGAMDAVGLRLIKIEHSLVATSRALGASKFDASEPVMLLGIHRGRPELGVSYQGQLLLDYRPASISPALMKCTDLLVGGIISKQIKCVRRYLQMQLPRGTDELSKVCLPSDAGLSLAVAEDLHEMHSLVTAPVPEQALLKHLGLESDGINSWESFTAVWLASEDEPDEATHADLMTSLKKRSDFSGLEIAKLVWPIAATLLLVLGVQGRAWYERNSAATLTQNLESLQPQRIEFVGMKNTLAKLNSRIACVQELEQSVPKSDWCNVIKFAGRALPQGTWLRNIKVEPDHLVAISGASFTDEAIYEFVEKLRDSQLFLQVTLDGTRSVRTASGPAFEFEISSKALTTIENEKSVANRQERLRL